MVRLKHLFPCQYLTTKLAQPIRWRPRIYKGDINRAGGGGGGGVAVMLPVSALKNDFRDSQWSQILSNT